MRDGQRLRRFFSSQPGSKAQSLRAEMYYSGSEESDLVSFLSYLLVCSTPLSNSSKTTVAYFSGVFSHPVSLRSPGNKEQPLNPLENLGYESSVKGQIYTLPMFPSFAALSDCRYKVAPKISQSDCNYKLKAHLKTSCPNLLVLLLRPPLA